MSKLTHTPLSACVVLLPLLAGCAPANGPPVSQSVDEGGGACTAASLALADAFRQIDSLLTHWRDADAIPGLAAGVVCAGELAWANGYGVMALHDPRPVTPETRFRVASITKVFTATAIMKLAQNGALDLDDPVSRHLTWFSIRRPPRVGDEPATIRHLLTHSSGLPRDSRLTDFRRRVQPARKDAIAALPSQSLEASPGSTIAYSNLGYGVLGEVIAEASGTSYAEFLTREIFVPLRMAETLVHPNPHEDVAWGHGPRRRDGSRARAGFWELGFATPAGGMASSVVDLSRFVILHLAPYTGGQPGVLSPPMLKGMHEVHHMIDPARGGGGLGWAVEISSGQHLVYHGGELPEQTSFLLIDLRTQIGVIVLTNAQGVDANAIAQESLRIVRAAVLGPGTPFPHPAIPPA